LRNTNRNLYVNISVVKVFYRIEFKMIRKMSLIV